MARLIATARAASSARSSVVKTQNLLLRSESLDNASWTKSNGSVTANQAANPIDGAMTADAFSDDNTPSTNHIVYQTYASFKKGYLYEFSVYVKNVDASVPCILMSLNGGSSGPLFNLVAGTINDNSIGKIESVGNGWYRCTAFLTMTGASFLVQIYSAVSFSTISHNGTNGVVYYVWGAQLVQSNWAGPYVQTVGSAVNTGNIRGITQKLQNLLIQSEVLDNSAWLKTASAISADTIANPVDGAVTADTLTASAGGTFHYVAYNNAAVYKTLAPVGNGPFTFSIYVKRNNNDWIALMTQDNHNASNAIYFNTNTGAFGSTGANATVLGATAKIEQTLANGWYRLSVTIPKIQDYASATAGFGVFLANADGGNSFSAAGTEAVYLFGAQLVNANRAGTYTQTVAQNLNYGNIRNKIT